MSLLRFQSFHALCQITTKKCRFLDKRVREISRFFVVPPRVFPLSVRARPRTVLSTNTSSLVCRICVHASLITSYDHSLEAPLLIRTPPPPFLATRKHKLSISGGAAGGADSGTSTTLNLLRALAYLIYRVGQKSLSYRLRDSACWRSGEITQPRANFLGQLCTVDIA